MGTFDPNDSVMNTFFSTTDVETLFIHLANFLTQKTVDNKLHSENFEFESKILHEDKFNRKGEI